MNKPTKQRELTNDEAREIWLKAVEIKKSTAVDFDWDFTELVEEVKKGYFLLFPETPMKGLE